MMITIADVLNVSEVAALREHLAGDEAQFYDGAKTAGWQAKSVKANEQMATESAEPVLAKVRQALSANPVFTSAARPKAFVKMLISRYRAGMEYGLHVDDAVMGGTRTDLSFTLFISDPADYNGGALALEDHSGTTEIKLPAGSLFLYPTKSLHRVMPVTSGERLVVVGWVRSLVRGDNEREILFDLDQAVTTARNRGDDRESLNRLLKIRNNLLRLWLED